MEVNGGFEEDPLAPGCYSQLLLADEILGLETDDERFGFASPFSSGDNHSNIVTPKMLCFGDCPKQSKGKVELENVNEIREKSEVTRTVSLKKKRGGSRVQNPGANSGALTGSQSNSKKPRPDSRVSGHPKTDTASVLHEASGYIRFLQDQVQVLCSPYSPCWSPSSEAPPGPLQKGDKERKGNEGRKCDLRSRGFCLVPVELTLHIRGLL